MSKRRLGRTIRWLSIAGLLLAAAGCAAYRGAIGVNYGPRAAYPTAVYGSSFYLGRGAYQVVYRPDGYGYYFRTRALGPGRYCSRYCYAQGRTFYHHASCRRFAYVARRYGTYPDYLIRAYGPR